MRARSWTEEDLLLRHSSQPVLSGQICPAVQPDPGRGNGIRAQGSLHTARVSRVWTVVRTTFNTRTPLACLGQSSKALALPSVPQTTSGSSVFQGGNYQVLSRKLTPHLLNGHGFSYRLRTVHKRMGNHQVLCRRAPGHLASHKLSKGLLRPRLQEKATSSEPLPPPGHL